MALPVQTNTTFDLFRPPNFPPTTPDVSGVPCFLRPAFREGQEAGEANQANHYTHVMSVALSVDVRDGNASAGTGSYSVNNFADVLCVPDKDGTQFVVYFVERVGRGTASDHKRVYLARSAVTWPTDEL